MYNEYCILTGERFPIIKNAVRVESNKNASLFSAQHLSGDDSKITGISFGGSIDIEDVLDAGFTLVVSNFSIIFESDQDE